jgi:tetratricopeptide (TPR) repeat protein
MVLANDSRFSMLGNRRSCRIHLNPGLHRLVVKFTSDAAPFSIDVHPVFSRTSAAATPIALSAAAQGYIRGLLAWFRGDLNEVAHVAATARDDHKRALLYLEALLWSAAEDHSPRAHAAWQALAAAHPSAVLARIKVAEASDDSKLDWLRTEVADLQHLRPESEAVAQLAVSISRSNPDSASEAWGQLIRIHPTCSALLQAIKVYDLAGAQGEAERTEQRLARCAPESLDYSRVLSDSGRHNEAIAFLQRRLSRNPLNRNARRMLVQELVLAGEWQKAKSEALQLHRIAHRSADYARLASDPAAVLNSRSERARGFARGNEFYSKYRRDGVAAVGQSASETSPAGVPALVILADQVLEIQNDGTASLYCHQLTRLLSLQAIGQYGEVRVPAGADLLELRTIKPDGRTIEPELNHQKRAISMPGLEPGDSIDQEFVTHYEDWRHLPPATLRFQLGAGNTPVLQTRLVTIAPTNEEVRFALFNGAPRPIRTMSDRHVVLTWEMDHLPASVPEPFAPSIPVPTVTIKGTENELDSVRDSLLGSTRVGPHVTEALLEQTFATVTDREKARRLYQLVNAKIESSGTDLADIPAEDSLAAGQGSRTSALLALTRAAGLEAALLLARRIGANCSDDLACYSEPLVRLWLPGEVVDVDPNVDGLAFGEIPPGLDHSRVLLVALDTRAAEKGPHTPEFVALNSSPARERSVGTGDLFLDSRGNLRVSVQITPGAARAQEIRSSLHSRTDREQRTFLEQLAERLFVGATDVRGQLLHLNDPEQPLNIILQCEVPQFLKMQPGRREIAQLAPLLGLGSDLTIESTRHSPLLLDSVLSETTVFHLHLPPAVSVAGLPPNIFLHSEFGEYALKFSRGDGQLNVERQFDIPVQVIETQLYPDFRRFVKNIDEAEHQRIVLEIRAVSSLRQALQPGPK